MPDDRKELLAKLAMMADYWDNSAHPDHKQHRNTINATITALTPINSVSKVEICHICKCGKTERGEWFCSYPHPSHRTPNAYPLPVWHEEITGMQPGPGLYEGQQEWIKVEDYIAHSRINHG